MFKQWLYNLILNCLTKPVELTHIITVSNTGQVKIDGNILAPQELIALQQEVKAFQAFRIYHILMNLPKAHAEHRMFTDAKNWDDMLAGKLMLYNVSIQENALLAILTAPKENQPIAMQQNPYRK